MNENEMEALAITALRYGSVSANKTVVQLINSLHLDRLAHLIRYYANLQTVTKNIYSQ